MPALFPGKDSTSLQGEWDFSLNPYIKAYIKAFFLQVVFIRVLSLGLN
jgi:hypothetical protein